MKNKKFNGLVAYKRKLNYYIVNGGRRFYAFTQKEKKIRRSLSFHREYNKFHFYINPLGLKTNFFPF
ncbi:hypothetical protein BK649P1_00017 [Bacteroides phage BK649P1]|nr:hypothetical protein BK649P1_00017 [Bacteroides phage BK649P1]